MVRTLVGFLTLAVAASLILAMVACSSQPQATPIAEPPYAGEMAENILISLDKGDYNSQIRDYDETMKKVTTPQAFADLKNKFKNNIGSYSSKQFSKAESQGKYIIVVYNAKYTLEPGTVTVRVVFQEVQGKTLVAGLWFNSPKLGG